jgi:hypothetical protein
MKRLGLVLAVLGLVACGGDDGDGGGSGGGSFGAIANSIAMPTGTVDMETVPAIADEFEKVRSGSAGGERFEQSNQNIMMACPAGGSSNTMASGNQSAVTGHVTYDNCCYTSADCCISGDSTFYFSTNGAQSDSTQNYMQCVEYAVTSTCGGSAVNLDYEGCFSNTGVWTYVVRIEGESFAVSGNYSGGNGTLEIRGANGNYTCTYTNGSGSCTGDGSFSF